MVVYMEPHNPNPIEPVKEPLRGLSNKDGGPIACKSARRYRANSQSLSLAMSSAMLQGSRV